ncbi:hypothetical protein HPB49_002056 [Dermacentor silvarum]|uniref:Uncharacterized protein n=1 Tax=Dermacentor silvarum TaxID=543639 RepID=A0ACB8DST7_DERSI|nr:hypothetical protein HPB49_002056 [Dermacentor silvarum]
MWAAEHVLGGGDRPKSPGCGGARDAAAGGESGRHRHGGGAAVALRGPASPSPRAPSSRLRNAAQAASMTRPLPLLLPVVLVAAAASGARCPQDQDRWDASNKALTSSLVFQGRLLSKSVDAAGNLLARFRVQKVLKPMPTATLRRRQEVVVALVKSRPPPTPQHLNRSASPRAPRRDALNNEALAPRRRTLCPVSVPQGFVFNARYLVYANPIAGRAARRLLLPAAANFSAAATPDHYTRRAGRAVKKVVCNGCAFRRASAAPLPPLVKNAAPGCDRHANCRRTGNNRIGVSAVVRPVVGASAAACVREGASLFVRPSAWLALPATRTSRRQRAGRFGGGSANGVRRHFRMYEHGGGSTEPPVRSRERVNTSPDDDICQRPRSFPALDRDHPASRAVRRAVGTMRRGSSWPLCVFAAAGQKRRTRIGLSGFAM